MKTQAIIQKIAIIGVVVSAALWQFAWSVPPKPTPLTKTITVTIGTETDENTLKSHLKAGDPLRVDAMAFLGLKAYRANQPEKAKAYFQDTLRFLPESSHPKLAQVLALTGLGIFDVLENTNYTSGKQKLEQALQIGQTIEPKYRPLIAQLYAGYGYVLFETGHVGDAHRVLQKALALDPKCQICLEAQSEIQAFDQSPDYFEQILKHGQLTRWNDETRIITVHVASGTGLKDWNPQFGDMAQTAFSAWQNATNGRFEFRYVNDAKLADVRLRWLEVAIPSNEGDGGSTGISIPEFLDFDMVSNDIELSLHYNTGKPVSKDEVYSSLLHEIGHMLGLSHSPNPADVMSTESMANVITARDIATLNKLYQTKPQYTNPTGMALAQFRNQNL